MRHHTDTISVTPDEALALCAHHTALAILFFEAIPSGREEERKATFIAAIKASGQSAEIARCFWDAATAYYEGLGE